MVFRYFGRENSELSMEEVEALKIWNTTMEHIFAQAIESFTLRTWIKTFSPIIANGTNIVTPSL